VTAPSLPGARRYRILCILTILHSLLLIASYPLATYHHPLAYRAWVGIATIWFLWILVLCLHPGRSILRVALTLIVAAPLWIPVYALDEAPYVFGLPFALEPVSTYLYCSAYVRGRFEAERDLKAGKLAIEGYGLWGPAWDTRTLLREQYHVEIRQTAGCGVSLSILGHAKGYNHVSIPEIEHRLGKNFLKSFGAVPFSEPD
jgi:hypothetical protein